MYDEEPNEDVEYCGVCGDELSLDEDTICDACKNSYHIR